MRWTHAIGRLAIASAMGAAIMAGPVSGPADAATRCHTPWGSLSKQALWTYVDLSELADGPNAHLAGLRSARHRCFDRLVLDFDEFKVQGFEVSYVNEVRFEHGSVMPLAGVAFLNIDVNAPYVPTEQSSLLPLTGYRTFRQVTLNSSANVSLGVRARLPFRVLALDGPGDGSRLVIDVAHRW